MAVSPQVMRVGAGAPMLLVHGSAADRTTWSIQLASKALRERFTLGAYDRVPGPRSIEQHADDLAALIDEPAFVVGSSFGAVVVLDLVRRRPERVRAAVLCEPPLAASDDAPPIPEAFLGRFDAIAAAEGGDAAGELFLREVLGDAAYERMPRMFQVRAKALWRAIRDDCAALGDYRVRYAELGAIDVPILLVAGERSAPFYRATALSLARGLGRAGVEILAGAGHMMHAEAHRAFAELLIGFCARANPR